MSEAIDLLRGVWDVDDHGHFRYNGDHYSVNGAKRGPAPAHEIPIALGAYKPRMLRLTGAKADGWLPSLGYLEPGDLDPANRRIDEAAQEAGRDPRAIRRMLNVSGSFTAPSEKLLHGPPAQWVEQLLPLALDDGISSFIVAADDRETIERYAGEVAPALREAVARERRSPGTTVE